MTNLSYGDWKKNVKAINTSKDNYTIQGYGATGHNILSWGSTPENVLKKYFLHLVDNNTINPIGNLPKLLERTDEDRRTNQWAKQIQSQVESRKNVSTPPKPPTKTASQSKADAAIAPLEELAKLRTDGENEQPVNPNKQKSQGISYPEFWEKMKQAHSDESRRTAKTGVRIVYGRDILDKVAKENNIPPDMANRYYRRLGRDGSALFITEKGKEMIEWGEREKPKPEPIQTIKPAEKMTFKEFVNVFSGFYKSERPHHLKKSGAGVSAKKLIEDFRDEYSIADKKLQGYFERLVRDGYIFIDPESKNSSMFVTGWAEDTNNLPRKPKASAAQVSSQKKELEKITTALEDAASSAKITYEDYLNGYRDALQKYVDSDEYYLQKSKLMLNWVDKLKAYSQKGGVLSQEMIDGLPERGYGKWEWGLEFNNGIVYANPFHPQESVTRRPLGYGATKAIDPGSLTSKEGTYNGRRETVWARFDELPTTVFGKEEVSRSKAELFVVESSPNRFRLGEPYLQGGSYVPLTEEMDYSTANNLAKHIISGALSASNNSSSEPNFRFPSDYVAQRRKSFKASVPTPTPTTKTKTASPKKASPTPKQIKLKPGARFLAEAGLSDRIREREGMKAIANSLDTKTKLDTGSYEIGRRGSGSTHLGELDVIRLNKPSKQYPMGSASVIDSTGDRQVLDMGRLMDGVERQMLAKQAIAIGMRKDQIGRMDNTALKKAIDKESPVSKAYKAIAPLEELAKLRTDGGKPSQPKAKSGLVLSGNALAEKVRNTPKFDGDRQPEIDAKYSSSNPTERDINRWIQESIRNLAQDTPANLERLTAQATFRFVSEAEGINSTPFIPHIKDRETFVDAFIAGKKVRQERPIRARDGRELYPNQIEYWEENLSYLVMNKASYEMMLKKVATTKSEKVRKKTQKSIDEHEQMVRDIPGIAKKQLENYLKNANDPSAVNAINRKKAYELYDRDSGDLRESYQKRLEDFNKKTGEDKESARIDFERDLAEKIVPGSLMATLVKKMYGTESDDDNSIFSSKARKEMFRNYLRVGAPRRLLEKYLGIPKTKAEAKKAFRDFAAKHHPDKGGDLSLFQTISAQYEDLIQYIP